MVIVDVTLSREAFPDNAEVLQYEDSHILASFEHECVFLVPTCFHLWRPCSGEDIEKDV
jgi:hypothetical protein